MAPNFQTTNVFPPTPAPSTDIKGKDNSLGQIDAGFSLPPSAVNHSVLEDGHALPPPPPRSRKIIQVKPKSSSEERDATYTPAPRPGKLTTKEPGKRKTGPSASTAAGRKVARKTAHSIIERRRRSKMNEEFGVLKDLIPACRGCDMHKLAILQASIEYLRYLEDCVSELKGEKPASHAPFKLSGSQGQIGEHDDQLDQDSDAGNDEMVVDETSELQQPLITRQYPTSSADTRVDRFESERNSPTSTTASATTAQSPAFGPVSSHSSAAISHTTSPVFGPYYSSHDFQVPRYSIDSRRDSVSQPNWPYTPSMLARVGSRQASICLSTQTSPLILPQHRELNEAEASTALLMLNQDRRVEFKPNDKRGMSVKDLLSS